MMRHSLTNTLRSIIDVAGALYLVLVAGLAAGVITAFGLPLALPAGLAVGLAFGLRGVLPAGVHKVGVSVGLAFGLAFALTGGLGFALTGGLAYSIGYFTGFSTGLVLTTGTSFPVAFGWQRTLAERLAVAVAAAQGLSARSKRGVTSQASSLSLEAALQRAAKELAHRAQTLPEDQREATLLTAIDTLYDQGQTADEVARMAQDLGRGMLDTALRDYLRQPDSFTRLLDSTIVRLLGAGVAIATVLTIVTSLSQLLAGDLDLGRFAALVVLLVGAGLLGGVAAVGEVRRRQP